MGSVRKIFLISLIFGLISLILIVFGIFPLFKGIKKNSQELIQTKQDLFFSQEKMGGINQIKKIYEEIEPDFRKIESFFIDPGAPIDLIKFFESVAEGSTMSIDIISAVPKTIENDPWNSLEFQIILTGSFPNFSKFLEKIETGPYLVEIQNLNVKRLTEQDIKLPKYEKLSLGDVSATLVAKVFTK